MVLGNHKGIKGSSKRYNYSEVMIVQQTTEQTSNNNTTGSNPEDDGEKRPEPILIQLLYTKEELDEYYKQIGKVRHKQTRNKRYITLIDLYLTDLDPKSKNINLTNIPNLEKRREELEYHIEIYTTCSFIHFRRLLEEDYSEDEVKRLTNKLGQLKLEFYHNSKYRIYQRNYSLEHKQEEKRYNKRYYEENKEFLKQFNKDKYKKRLQRLEKFTEQLTLGTLEKTVEQMTIEELGIYIKHHELPIKNFKRKSKNQLLTEIQENS